MWQVCDLGLAKVKCRTFVSGGVRGTLPWMAPELMDGGKVSEKVCSLFHEKRGICSLELLCGVPQSVLNYLG